MVLKCNFCKCEMVHHVLTENEGDKLKHDDTHIYVCQECPNITFEFTDSHDLKRLNKYLTKGVF